MNKDNLNNCFFGLLGLNFFFGLRCLVFHFYSGDLRLAASMDESNTGLLSFVSEVSSFLNNIVLASKAK